MVLTDFSKMACSGSGSLPESFIASRSADRLIGVSGFLISCARRRATSPQACARCAETISEMSSKTNSLVASGSSAPRTTRLGVCWPAPPAAVCSSNGCSQWASPGRSGSPKKASKWPGTAAANSASPGTSATGRPSKAAIGAHRMRVAPGLEERISPCASSTMTPAVRVEHDDRGGEVVQNGLQVGARCIDLAHALLDGLPGVGQLLGHQRKRPGQPAKLVLALQHGVGAEVAGGHLAHPFGQHQQWPDQLLAQQHGQQHGAENRQEQAQRQRTHIHAPQASAHQGPFLVLAVGLLHGNGIGDQRWRQAERGLQVARLQQQVYAGVADQRQHLDPRVLHGGLIGNIVESLDLCRGALLATAWPAAFHSTMSVAPIWSRRRSSASPAAASGTWASWVAALRVLATMSAASESSDTWARLTPADNAPSTFTSNQLSMERVTNW